jgi:2-isopropylmalate synthase
MRDGEASPGNAMTVGQKVELGLKLESLGIDVIEPGFAAASETDREASAQLSQLLRSARLSGFCRSRREDIDCAIEHMGGHAETQLQILVTGSDIHLIHKRSISREQGIAEAVDSVAYARSRGIENVSIAVEDATRGDPDYMRELVLRSIEAGATILAIPDTVGCSTPDEFKGLVALFRNWVDDAVLLSIHCHDDMGLALANTLSGISAGADEVQVTLGGIGERAGNTALEEFAAVLRYKGEALGVATALRHELIFGVASWLLGEIRAPIARNKSIIGENAFSTQAGIHQAAILSDPRTYEFVRAQDFGRERGLLIGRQSGRVAMRHVLQTRGVEVDEARLETLYQEICSSNQIYSSDDLVAQYHQSEG